MAHKHLKGAPAPLFDRIVNEEKAHSTHVYQHLLDEEALKASVIKEVEILLNTRCTIRRVIYEDHIENIPFFGLPDFFGLTDFSYFDAGNSNDWPKIARYIETAISAAEPRLKGVRVRVQHYDRLTHVLTVNVAGTIKSGNLVEKISFPLAISQKDEKGTASPA